VEDVIRSIRDGLNLFYSLTPAGAASVRVGRGDDGLPVLRAVLDERLTDHVEESPDCDGRSTM